MRQLLKLSILVALVRAELTYFCKKDGADQVAMSEAEYQECGLNCICTAQETLCYSRESIQNSFNPSQNTFGITQYTFAVATYEYASQCRSQGCICN